MKTKQIAQNMIHASLLTGALLMVGCNSTSTPSDFVQTQGIWAKIDVTAREDGRSRVVVELNVGGEFGTNVVLSPNEYLEVSANGETAHMNKDTDIFDIDYQAYLDVTDSNTEFNIRFYRNNGEAIVDSYGKLPEAFSITSPQVEEEYSYQDTITLNWTPLQQSNSIRLVSLIKCYTLNGGNQASVQQVNIDDDGIYQFVIDDHPMFSDGFSNINRSRACELDFTLRRERGGNVDSEFDKDSYFSISQSRSLKNITINL